ncbi:SLAP domain-containing protein [Agrilactobacillus yilanensis]|uniref:SLAP domain-containing protein n=1 Tax=Agrilactobacillus yilanensis TaxID=2485997 RepID=A0ABW4JDC9_9LACO|nr:SLAP domain-containing protein [Agrilactobacillus yilanensis]
MKLRNLVFSALALGTISTATITTTADQTFAATASTTMSLDTTMYAARDTAVYTAPAGNTTGQTLTSGTAWHVSSKQIVRGTTWYEVGGDQWVKGADLSTNPIATALDTTMYVVGTYGAAVFNSPYADRQQTGQTLEKDSGWHVSGQVTVNGETWYEVGGGQWVWGPDMSADQPITQTPGIAMTATAYDPRVLGNYTFGYDTVAANLSVFPRGTKLNITFANGTSKDYVVRDTGTFAYANPNQLDIAMPNSQALQFGRQSITVRVIS